jgi:hypothetical protein
VKAQAAVAKRWAGGLLPLLAMSAYGIADGDASQGHSVSAAAVWVDARDGKIRFQTGVGSTPVNPEAPIDPYLLDLDGRKFSKLGLMPDQNSRRVISFVQDGVCTVSRVISNVDRRDSWAGHDCVLFWDGFLLDSDRSGAASDIIAFYLSVDRLIVLYRLQNENFQIEHVYGTLEKQCSLDAVAISGLSLALYLSPKKTAPGDRTNVISAPYPSFSSDNFYFSAAFQSGLLFNLIVACDPTQESFTLSSNFQGGIYFQVVVGADLNAESLSMTSSFSSGVLQIVVVLPDSTAEVLNFTTNLQSGDLKIVVIEQGNPYVESLSFAVALWGGVYA